MTRKIIVGFTTKSTAVLPRFFCALFRHCAIITDGMLIQIASDGIRSFKIGKREITKLEESGWMFMEYEIPDNHGLKIPHILTCVGFAKKALGINNIFIWTPDQLFRFIYRSMPSGQSQKQCQ
jgi:hypothetical protein